MNTKVDQFITARKEAEKIVADMPEGPLKEKAFEVAFTHLLGTSRAKSSPSRRKRASSSRRDGKPSRARRGGVGAHVKQLVDDGFLAKGRRLQDVVGELRRGGHRYEPKAVSTALQRLTKSRTLRRDHQPDERGHDVWVYEVFRQGK